MANNKMYLNCKKCNKSGYFAKYYPSNGWFMNNKIFKELNVFLQEHKNCSLEFDHLYDDNGENFRLLYECNI